MRGFYQTLSGKVDGGTCGGRGTETGSWRRILHCRSVGMFDAHYRTRGQMNWTNFPTIPLRDEFGDPVAVEKKIDSGPQLGAQSEVGA